MSACKDCLHHKVCEYNDNYDHHAMSLCEDFKNKDEFVKITYCRDCQNFVNNGPDDSYCSELSDGWGDNIIFVNEDDFCSFSIERRVPDNDL